MSISLKGKLEPQFRVEVGYRGPRNRQHLGTFVPWWEGSWQAGSATKASTHHTHNPAYVSPGGSSRCKDAHKRRVKNRASCRTPLQSPANNFLQRSARALCLDSVPPSALRHQAKGKGQAGRGAVNCPLFLPLQKGMFSH